MERGQSDIQIRLCDDMKRILKGLGILTASAILMVGCGDNNKNNDKSSDTGTKTETSTENKESGNEDNSDSSQESSEPRRKIPEAGDDAPEIDVTNLEDGSAVNLEGLKGKRTLINFFATWCGPCKMEMPDLEKLYQNYGEEYNILAVSSGESEEELNQYKEEMSLTLPIYKDSSEGSTVKSYFVRVVPTSYMIDENGKIEMVIPGVLSYEDMEKLLKGE